MANATAGICLAAEPSAASEFNVSGSVQTSGGASVSLTGKAARSTAVNSGHFSFAGVGAGAYTVTPAGEGQVFTPASVAVTVNEAQSDLQFAGAATSAPTFRIGGTVSGSVAAGVIVTLNGANVGSVVTDMGGSYSFSGVAAGTYTLSAWFPGNLFGESKVVTITNVDSVRNDFTSRSASAGTPVSFALAGGLPQATVGTPYRESVLKDAVSPSAALIFQTGTFATGAPPVGLTLGADGTLSGTPREAGTFEFEVCASSGISQNAIACEPASITVGTDDATMTAASAAASWVFYNGNFDWPGDYSYDAVPDYVDKAGAPLSGNYDIKVTLTGAWGGWLPYAKNWDFNSVGYTTLRFSLKPTKANQVWHVYFVKVGDIPVGIYLDVSKYGPAPVAGKWATYEVPLSALGVLNKSIYKFCIQDQTGLSHNVWYVDNVGFVK